MLRRRMIRGALTIAALLIAATPALAGGWAVVTLDRLPRDIAAGTPITIGFTVRQHGQTLRDDLEPSLEFKRSDGSEPFSVTAARDGASGHYRAEVSFPGAGIWAWRVNIERFGMLAQPMPDLTVRPPAVARVGARRAGGDFFSSLMTTLRALLQPVQTSQPASLAEIGRDVFLAKGCAMCHTHEAVAGAWDDFGPIEIGPNLTNWKTDADFLRRWLKNPSSVRPGTDMPTLGLSDAEIDALIAFLIPSETSSTGSLACPVTIAPDVRPLDAHLAAWSPEDAWYHSPDGLIWVAENNIAGIPVGDTTKVLWGKPAQHELSVAGRRLDANAPPLMADVSPYYRDEILNPSGIGFPTAGCWLIDARAGKSVLRIVVEVPEQSSQR